MPKRRKVVPRTAAATIRVEATNADGKVVDTARRTASLLVVQGAAVDLGHLVVCDRPVTIGRDDKAELALSDGSISRRHCRVERDAQSGHYLLVDLGSTNGTSVNARRVDGHVPLTEGDKIFLGASVVRFSYADSVDLEYQSMVQEMVRTDPLTGLSSRREYDIAYKAMVDKAAVDRQPLSLLVMDMDGLKQINDTHGHDFGGFAIVEVSRLMREVLEPHGLLCRFGGDEFVACLPGIQGARACELAEELRARVAAHRFEKDGIAMQPTVSIGVATYPPDAVDAETLFAAADRALYQAKRRGRNRVAVFAQA
jgi:diguanylate cyclase (GGDEF)-like protein